MTISRSENLIPKQIKPNVYTAECFAGSGEKVYLHMELLTPENEKYWTQYKNHTHLITKDEIAGIVHLGVYTRFNRKDDDYEFAFLDNDESYIPETGFNEVEFKNFIELLGSKGFHDMTIYDRNTDTFFEKKDKLNILARTSEGLDAMHTTADLPFRYVVYATKTPDFDIQRVPIRDKVNLKEFRDMYNDLVMCVGSDLSQETTFENRGIARNPINVIEDDYKGLAMILHGFTASVIECFFKEKKALVIRPLPIMQYLICSTLKPEDVTIEGMSFEEARKNSKKYKEISYNKAHTHDYPRNSIHVSALTRYYYNLVAPKSSIYKSSHTLLSGSAENKDKIDTPVIKPSKS